MSRRDEQLALCGVCWDETTFDEIPHSSVERVRSRYRHSLPELIWNTAALEGNTFTLPEVRTLLDGVTVGGRPIGDAHQILALRDAFQDLDLTVGDGTFVLSKPIGDRLHGIVAVHEAIESGHFRGEGRVQGGGTVRLSNGGVVVGCDPVGAASGVQYRARRHVHVGRCDRTHRVSQGLRARMICGRARHQALS